MAPGHGPQATPVEAGQIRWRTARPDGGPADPAEDNVGNGDGTGTAPPTSLSLSLSLFPFSSPSLFPRSPFQIWSRHGRRRRAGVWSWHGRRQRAVGRWCMDGRPWRRRREPAGWWTDGLGDDGSRSWSWFQKLQLAPVLGALLFFSSIYAGGHCTEPVSGVSFT